MLNFKCKYKVQAKYKIDKFSIVKSRVVNATLLSVLNLWYLYFRLPLASTC